MAFNLSAADTEILVKHEHHHVHNVKKGSSLSEMLKMLECSIVPGALTGAVDGAISGLNSSNAFNTRSEFKYDRDRLNISEGVTAGVLSMLRETSLFPKSEDTIDAYVIEKTTHNMAKYVAGLFIIEMCNLDASGNINEQKALFIERFSNALFREKKIIEGNISRAVLHAIIRGLSESIVSKGNQLMFNPYVGMSAVAGILVGEAISKAYLKKGISVGSKKYIERIVTALCASSAKILLKNHASSDYDANSGSLTIDTKGLVGQYLLDAKTMGITAAGVTSIAWIAQNERAHDILKFANHVVTFVENIIRLAGRVVSLVTWLKP
jgi:hypothetical protein